MDDYPSMLWRIKYMLRNKNFWFGSLFLGGLTVGSYVMTLFTQKRFRTDDMEKGKKQKPQIQHVVLQKLRVMNKTEVKEKEEEEEESEFFQRLSENVSQKSNDYTMKRVKRPEGWEADTNSES
ncbi:uncharacterized protein LOC106163322 [Lingula anatina]|uniref:Uncharacterized protein LOC106163322 n=1 Tax=Lingula anatina TaxID=7574 RepID=A0A1S3IFT6_LINAN|nr:uncharacterized protein LOC106163322 [Lingula anatina]|eukprot:XP_013396334.1 uncharacterized protein LOC106163322 [Lingula anatina]